MLTINETIIIPEEDLVFEAVRAQGAGGQHVNKTATAIQLRYDIVRGTLPEPVKKRLLRLRDRRITREGVIVIKAQQHRSQEQNRAEARQRLAELVQRAVVAPKPRRPTRPSNAARERRIAAKKRRGEMKSLRQRPNRWEE